METILVVGATGLVGIELLRYLKAFPDIIVAAPSRLDPFHRDIPYDVAFFCTPAAVSLEWIPQMKARRCIDLSSAFRTDPSVPLIVPEINGNLAETAPLIACPNCIAAIVSLPLFVLTRLVPVRRILMTTFQATSGSGKYGVEALRSRDTAGIYPEPIRENCFFHESPKDGSGYCEEENKIIFELGKILRCNFPIEVRSIRAPLERCHCISLDVECALPIDPQLLEKGLAEHPSLRIDPLPTPLKAQGKETVWVSPPRLHKSNPCSINLWIVGDQLLRGAAWNAYQLLVK